MDDRQREKKRFWSVLAILLLLVLAYTPPVYNYASIPSEVRLMLGRSKELHLSIPASTLGTTDQQKVISLEHHPSHTFTIQPRQTGEANLQVKMGDIPIKNLHVQVFPELLLYPGGQSIGVKLHSAGILVVGHKQILNHRGESSSPAKEANIHVGDLITKINGKTIREASALGKIVDEAGRAGKSLQIEFIRGKEKLNVQVTPIKDEEDQRYKLGLYVRDSAAGIGTLTFYDPKTKRYGALGHVISDQDTQKPISVGKGSILPSTVTSVDRGEQGKPGSIRAIFSDEKSSMGNIEKNSPFGIFGKLNSSIPHLLYREPIPVAFVEEVKEGPAEILTVVDGDKVGKYSIEIVNVIRQRYPSTKSMIIKVTDPRLLEKTGGIVQGMSGSPIIQNGKLVGAVTHVFVNDPTQGYGLFIEWMLEEAGYSLHQLKKAS
ncbi:MAG: SpoIVB peptidase [Thermicanus sp.]|nr:SpoIVB peptidase [Thermicanus sp.]